MNVFTTIRYSAAILNYETPHVLRIDVDILHKNGINRPDLIPAEAMALLVDRKRIGN
jgi:hypothetical protein